jgi:ankyrin repeat protein
LNRLSVIINKKNRSFKTCLLKGQNMNKKILISLVFVLFIVSSCQLFHTIPDAAALHKDVFSCDIAMAKKDIADGADLNFRNYYGWTALHYAAIQNDPNMIQLLIRSGCDINARNKRGRTPLHLAALTGKTETVKTLLLNNAGKSIKDKRGKTPKQLTKKKEIIELFN